MSTVQEAQDSKKPLAAALSDGVRTLSVDEEITFELYAKTILPLDGYVFWVNARLLSNTALIAAAQPGQSELNEFVPTPIPPKIINAPGSLHYMTDVRQMEDKTMAFNHVIFTSKQFIQNLRGIGPNLMYIARHAGMKFAFSRQDSYYRQADLWHYRGDALYSIMDTQIIDSDAQLQTENVIVSNSLPIWLSLNKYCPMYPSYLVDLNTVPPYASVDIDPSLTDALQQFPRVDTSSNPWQLCKDVVRITFYGLRNNAILNFMQYVFQYSLNTDNIGIMNMPIPRDEKAIQPEMGILAMRKTVTFEVSYYQTTVNDIANKLITSATVSFDPQPL